MSVFQDEVWFWGQEILDGGRLSVGNVGNTRFSQTPTYILEKTIASFLFQNLCP